MKTTLVAALSAFICAIAHPQQLPQTFRTHFIPVIEADGAHTWAATVTIDKGYMALEAAERAKYVANEIGKLMAIHRFCERGWEITERSESHGLLTLFGRCR